MKPGLPQPAEAILAESPVNFHRVVPKIAVLRMPNAATRALDIVERPAA